MLPVTHGLSWYTIRGYGRRVTLPTWQCDLAMRQSDFCYLEQGFRCESYLGTVPRCSTQVRGCGFFLQGQNCPRPTPGRTSAVARSRRFEHPARFAFAQRSHPSARLDEPSLKAAASSSEAFCGAPPPTPPSIPMVRRWPRSPNPDSFGPCGTQTTYARPRSSITPGMAILGRYARNAAVRCDSPTSTSGTEFRYTSARNSIPRSCALAQVYRLAKSSPISTPLAAPPLAGLAQGPALRSLLPTLVCGRDATPVARSPLRLAPPPQPAGSRGSDAEHDLLSSAWHADRGSAVRPCTAPERPATVLANAAACPLPKLGLGKRESANGVLPAARRTTRRCRPRCRPYTRTGLRAICASSTLLNVTLSLSKKR